jgi:small nuclear ribonucleoprotein B and B'
VSVTLKDARVLVGTLMAVDKHVNLVLHNCEEYRRYKVRGKLEGKELKRLLGFVVVRGQTIVYVNPEELGKEELVEPVKPRKVKAAAAGKAPAAAPMTGLPTAGLPKAGAPGLNPALLQGLLRPGMPGLPGMPGAPSMPGMPMSLPGMPSMPGGRPPLDPAMLQQLLARQGMPGGMPGMPSLPGMPGMPMLGGMRPH